MKYSRCLNLKFWVKKVSTGSLIFIRLLGVSVSGPNNLGKNILFTSFYQITCDIPLEYPCIQMTHTAFVQTF